MSTPAAGDRRRIFEEQLADDRRRRQLANYGAWAVVLFSIAVLLTLLFAFERNSPWLVAITLYTVVTRSATLIVWKSTLFPRLALELDAADAGVAAAARAVFERHRAAIVRPILAEYLEPNDDEAVAAVAPERIAALAREHDIDGWRRLEWRSFLAWCALTCLLWGGMIASRGADRLP